MCPSQTGGFPLGEPGGIVHGGLGSEGHARAALPMPGNVRAPRVLMGLRK